MINLVALPCLCVDVFDGTDELRAGGEALNFAVHASKFEEFNVSILGAVGRDSYAKFIMDSISDKRIDVSHVRVEKDNPQIHVYGIVNCGFYEGIQAEYSLKILQNWCLKTGFIWSGGIGVGGGGGLAMMPKMEPGYGPKAPIDKALVELSNVILKKQVRENIYVSVAFPRFLYKMGAQIGWRQMIKANGGKVKDLKKCWDK